MSAQEPMGLLKWNSQELKQKLLTFHKAEGNKRILTSLAIPLPPSFTGRNIDTKQESSSKQKKKITE